ncbi:hypothetical protein Hanom_Chr05g00422311 [Helianthus anomalus]
MKKTHVCFVNLLTVYFIKLISNIQLANHSVQDIATRPLITKLKPLLAHPYRASISQKLLASIYISNEVLYNINHTNFQQRCWRHLQHNIRSPAIPPEKIIREINR